MALKWRFEKDGSALDASNWAIESVTKYLKFCQKLTSSRHTHYAGLDEWVDAVNKFISVKLKKAGFKNGKREMNDRIPDVVLWWTIYKITNSIINSEYLETKVALHHTSALERNNALINELYDIEAILK